MGVLTVGAALQEASAKLAGAGVESPRWDVQTLLAWVVKGRREDLACTPEQALTDREQLIFAKAISLRTERRPLPYITGEQWFYGRPFKINRAVLIPRPDTEILVAAALERCQTLVSPTLADIGTGSGCLAVTLACELPEAYVWATDISRDALTLARKNVVRHGVLDRVTLLHGDLLSPLSPDLPLDIVVSNPPYITEAELPALQPEVRDYEPQIALSGEPGATGFDGTTLHKRLLTEARKFLKPGGWILLEVGWTQAAVVAEFAREMGYQEVSIVNDLAGIGRVVAGLMTLMLVGMLMGCSARDPVDKTPVFHVGTPTNRSSVNSWELGSEPLYTQPGVSGGKEVHLKPIPSQRGFEPNDPVALDVLNALNQDAKTSTEYLSATAKSGVVILTGSVPNARQKARVERIASRVAGVKAVQSKVEIVP